MHRNLLVLTCLLPLTFVACGESYNYSNSVKFTCDDTVILDEIYTSKEACEEDLKDISCDGSSGNFSKAKKCDGSDSQCSSTIEGC